MKPVCTSGLKVSVAFEIRCATVNGEGRLPLLPQSQVRREPFW